MSKENCSVRPLVFFRLLDVYYFLIIKYLLNIVGEPSLKSHDKVLNSSIAMVETHKLLRIYDYNWT